jgi:hypothetical protein
MRLKLLTAIVAGTLVASLGSAAADIRGPLSPSGGNGDAGRGPNSISSGQNYERSGQGGGQFLFIPGDAVVSPTWADNDASIRGPLSPSNGRGGND